MNTPLVNKLALFATAPKGLELLLVDELKSFGAQDAQEKLAGVKFSGDLRVAYQACLWSRLANRVLLQLAEAPANDPDELYAAAQSIAWDEHLLPEGTLAVHVVCSQSKINHTLFAAQKVKDAIVDQFREKFGTRPNVDRERPDVSVYVYLHRDVAMISLDLSGDSLHKRGYRLEAGDAPLKENLAAAVLLRAGWPAIAKDKGTLIDPMCGSGTLVIEAALMAADVAPGLKRNYFGFLGWRQHDASLWQTLVSEAQVRANAGLQALPTMVGYDHDPQAIKIAFANLERAGLLGKVHVEKRDVATLAPKASDLPGLIVVNPPYGERLGEEEALQPLYTQLGERFKAAFTGWKAAVFTGNPDLGKQMGLRAIKFYALFNGALPCKLLLFSIEPAYFVDRSPEGDNQRRIREAKKAIGADSSSGLEMFTNRLRKNLKHLGKQAKRQGTESYRLYDLDLPDYAFAIDVTTNSAHVQEYQAPSEIDKKKALRRRQEVLAVLPDLLELPPDKIFFSILPRNKKEK